MTVSPEYPDMLADELAPFGLVFARMSPSASAGDPRTEIVFQADPESFVDHFQARDIVRSYGGNWPPEQLHLRIEIDGRDNVTQAVFEIYDLLGWASSDPGIGSQINTLADPAGQAASVGQAMNAVLTPYRDQAPWRDDL